MGGYMDGAKIKISTAEIGKHKMILLVIIISSANALLSKNDSISFIVALIEISIAFYYLFFMKLSSFLIVFLLLCCTSIESATLAFGDSKQTFISFLNLPVIASYHIYLMLFVADFRAIKNIKKITRSSSHIARLSKIFMVLFLVQALMMLVTYLINDNNVRGIVGIYRYSVRDMMYMFVTMSVVLLMSTSLVNDNWFGERFKAFSYDFLIGIVISALVLIATHNYYLRQAGTTRQLTCTLALMITSTMLLLFFYEKKYAVWMLLFGLLSILIQKEYTLGIAGTWWMMVGSTAFLFIFCSAPTKVTYKDLFKFISLILLVIILLVAVNSFDFLNTTNNYQSSYKLEAFKRILNWESDINIWYIALGESIQTRIEEIISIVIEFVNKPWFLLTGKGFGGTVLKHWGISNWKVYGSTFPDIQINAGVYSSLHTGIAEMFINAGLVGMFFYVAIIVTSIKQVLSKKRNVWCFMGIWGILFCYNFMSVAIATALLCYGFYLADEN